MVMPKTVKVKQSSGCQHKFHFMKLAILFRITIKSIKVHLFQTILLSGILLTSCDTIQEIFNKEEEIVLYPATVIGPKDGSEGVCLTQTIIVGKFDESVKAVCASYITVGDDYKSGPGFMDYLVVTQDTSDEATYTKITEYSDYPYPPEPPYTFEIVKKSRAYFYIKNLKPSTKYYWKIVHNAGDMLLDVTPFRSFTTIAKSDLSSSIEFARVDGGTFCFGDIACNISKNVEVELSSFNLGKYEITNAQYASFLNQIGSTPISASYYYDVFETWASIQYNFDSGRFEPKSGFHKCPANTVMWEGALAFSNYVGGRLPTMAEWEFAAKGGNLTHNYLYSGSNTPDSVAWTSSNAGWFRDVGTKKPNELGIYDMTGNVEEWCSDWYASFKEAYPVGKHVNPTGPATGTQKILKGGSALYLPYYNIVSDHLFTGSGYGQQAWKVTGFRVAKD